MDSQLLLKSNRSEKVQSITVSYNGKVINKEAAK